MVDIILMITALLGLWVGTELIIRSAIPIAKRFRLSDAVIGLSVLAIGSDLPELVVAVTAALNTLAGAGDASDVVLGTALGSAIGQFGLAIGGAGLVGYLTMPSEFVRRHGAVLIGAVALFFVLGVDGALTRLDGAIFVLFYALYVIMILKNHGRSDEAVGITQRYAGWRTWGVLAIGFALLWGNAEVAIMAIDGLSNSFNISEGVVSVVIIGLGSSLPELSLSVAALLKKRGALSVGNLVGSNVLDTVFVPGVAALITPLSIGKDTLYIDLPFLLALTLLVLSFFLYFRRGLQRHEAFVTIGLYVIFITFRFLP